MNTKANHTSHYELTILVPIFNEIESLPSLGNKLSEFLPKAKVKTAILLINDGSTDGSKEAIQKLCQQEQHFYYISLAQNSGLSAALKAGFDVVESPLVGYIDADLQTDPEDFNLLLDYTKDYQLVTGVRANRKDTFFKKLQSKIANSFRRAMTKDGATDTGCPLKILHSDLAKKLPMFTGLHRFFPALTLMMGGSYKELAVRHYPRQAGTSKYHLWNRLWGPFVDCFAYRWMKKRLINTKISEHNL
ncbi:MAG: glycosyltransferase [Bacteroides sp.]